MEYLQKEIISTPFRKAILHYVLIRGTTYPQQVSENLRISKGLPSQFLRLCTALGVTKRERNGHKVLYSLTTKGIAILKRLCPEIFDLSFSSIFENLSKMKFNTKYYPVEKIGFEVEKIVDNFGGITFVFYDADGKEISRVFKPKKGVWWCISCQSSNCKHINYLKKYYDTTN